MKKGRTREIILETATSLFQCQGYHGTGLSQIIEKSGAPKGSIYHYFPNGKEEMALEAINLMRKNVMQKAEADLAEKDNAVEAFQHHMNNIAALFDSKENTGLPIGLIASEIATTNPKLLEACKSAFTGWQSLYADRLEGFGYTKEKAAELSITINAMIEGGCILSITNQNGQPLRCIAKQMESLLVQ
ncbi:TetR/AcrR family transcriptional regulator [Mesobacillus foraminis]|jgi:TetR/AcrR family transcriptional repressor of lmrAB and yxaGH operons|uniref:TetR family transcriptional regulator n=1 Tax=Mesobacillus foraminis TaxID=279826 RepID=A0A4R2BGC1_9BACI|nr:TetR/AcrR family transcriptional regulator [Mesobacillus foraminis]TCN25009.1 TetR family transcriptional regulator [Mesobacillus foraminis]